MALISRATIDEINSRLDALVIAKDHVRLEQKGGRYWGLCPFHNEKTPSFTINPDLKSYYCFGCHKGGSIINLVMEMDKLTFPETIEMLAKRIGIDIQYENSDGSNFDNKQKKDDFNRKEALYELYRRMAGTFHHLLLKNTESKAAMNYIINRGINQEMIELFNLGYAPENRQWMHKFLLQKGYSREFLGSSGLFSANYPGIPLFSKRLMFPICERQGRVVAFGGRFLDDSNPAKILPAAKQSAKYINSPELEIYKKRDTLYAINLALPEIRKTKTVFIAEGYLDVIALHQAGITNSVAPLGTAFTDEQAKLLRRWAEKAVLVFDSDEAGQSAAIKGILSCRKNGLECAVVYNKDSQAKDPSDILQILGPEQLKKMVNSCINDFDYTILRAKSLYNTEDSGGKSSAIAYLFPYLKTLESDVSRDACIEKAASSIGTTKTAILNDLRQFNTSQVSNVSLDNSKGKKISMNDELFLLMLVAVNDFSDSKDVFYPELRKSISIKEIKDTYAKQLFITLEECFINDEMSIDNFLSRISLPELRDFYLERAVSKEFSINPRQVFNDGIKNTERRKLEQKLDEIVLKLKTLKMNSENNFEGESAENLLADKIHIDEKLRKLKEECQ